MKKNSIIYDFWNNFNIKSKNNLFDKNVNYYGFGNI